MPNLMQMSENNRFFSFALKCNEPHFARNQTNIIQTQCSINNTQFIFYRLKSCYKVFKCNRPSISLTDFIRLCCNASESGEPHSSTRVIKQIYSNSMALKWLKDFVSGSSRGLCRFDNIMKYDRQSINQCININMAWGLRARRE